MSNFHKFNKYIFKLIISIPITIYFNFKVLPIKKAWKLPFLIGYNTKLNISSNSKVFINSEISTFMIKINFSSGSGGLSEQSTGKGALILREKAILKFQGNCSIAKGSAIRCESGVLEIGRNFTSNLNLYIYCTQSIVIENDCLFGWNVIMQDNDGHAVYDAITKEQTNGKRSNILIGSHTWLGAKVTILKGVKLPENTIVGFNSCVTRAFSESNTLVAGYPASVKRKNVIWIQ